MFFGDKKKLGSALVITIGPKKPENDDDGMLDMVCEEILQAISTNDPKLLKDSLKSFIEVAKADPE